MARRIKAGTTDVSVVIRIVDSTDGTPETGVVFSTSGIDLEYRREGAASVDITEATLAALTTAHADGGFLHIGNGYYRLDLPDAACAAGATGVLIHGTVTGMVVIGEYIELVAYDPYDTVRLGLTALPNAAADAAGGLPISDAGGLDMDALLRALNALVPVRTTITVTNQTTVVLAAGSADDAAYPGWGVLITDQVTAAQKGFTYASSYTGATKTLVLESTMPFTIATGDLIDLIPPGFSNTDAALAALTTWVGAYTAIHGETIAGADPDSMVGQFAAFFAQQATLGTPAGASVSEDIAAAKAETAAIKAKTDQFTFTVANQVDANVTWVAGVQVSGSGTEGDPWGPV